MPPACNPDAGAKVLAIEGPTVYFNNGDAPTNIAPTIRSEPLSPGQLLGNVIGQPGVLQGFPGVAVADGLNPRIMAGVDPYARLRVTQAVRTNLGGSTIWQGVVQATSGMAQTFLVTQDFETVFSSIALQANMVGGSSSDNNNLYAIELARNIDGGTKFDSVTNSTSLVPIIRLNAPDAMRIYETQSRPSRMLRMRIYREGGGTIGSATITITIATTSI